MESSGSFGGCTSMLRRGGFSAAQIAHELRTGPVPVVDGPALQLADDIVRLQERVG